MSQKVDYELGIEDIRSTIHLKGIDLAEHSLHFKTLIRKFSEPHLREGMVSAAFFDIILCFVLDGSGTQLFKRCA